MKHYSVTQLIKEEQQGIQHKFLFFWGHQPDVNGQISKSCFSQWWYSPFEVDGVTYITAEHWMMAKKALLFSDNEMYQKIIEAKSPAEAKKLGRLVQNYVEKQWLENRMDIVIQGNYYKFSQHPALSEFLKNTGERILVEASPYDTIWGIGMVERDPNILFPTKWKGENLLGFALMEVRNLLKQNKPL